MNKGLEALENICNQCEHYQFEKGLRPKKCPFNKSCVYKERIKGELKALEIIRESTQLSFIEENYGEKEYFIEFNNYTRSKIKTKEDFELLKEVLL